VAMHLRRQKIRSAFTGAALAHACHDRERLRAPLAGFIRCTARSRLNPAIAAGRRGTSAGARVADGACWGPAT